METCRRKHHSLWDTCNSSLKKMRVCVYSVLVYLYWRCSVCWVWWSLCCRGCWWLLLWTDTNAEVSDPTEPHLQKGSKNTITSSHVLMTNKVDNRKILFTKGFEHWEWVPVLSAMCTRMRTHMGRHVHTGDVIHSSTNCFTLHHWSTEYALKSQKCIWINIIFSKRHMNA